jgi:hypothetical protein
VGRDEPGATHVLLVLRFPSAAIVRSSSAESLI